MADLNKKNNKKQKLRIKKTANQTNSAMAPYLYGMTLEEYREGAEIHSKCFDQLKMAMVLTHS